MNPTQDQINDALRTFQMERGTPVGAIPFKKLNEGATLPVYGSREAAGMDLCANMEGEEASRFILYPGKRHLFKTGLSTAIPNGFYGRIAPRSGLAYKSGIDVMAGVIDSDYRGDIGIILINLSDDPFLINHGDRIAQFIIEQYRPCLPFEVDNLDNTDRGQGGYGSTGK